MCISFQKASRGFSRRVRSEIMHFDTVKSPNVLSFSYSSKICMMKINVGSWMYSLHSIHDDSLTLTCSWNTIKESRAGGWMWHAIPEQNNITAYLKAKLWLLFPQRLHNTPQIAPKSQSCCLSIKHGDAGFVFCTCLSTNWCNVFLQHKRYLWLLLWTALWSKLFWCQKILKSLSWTNLQKHTPSLYILPKAFQSDSSVWEKWQNIILEHSVQCKK